MTELHDECGTLHAEYNANRDADLSRGCYWRTASRPPQQIRARRPCSSLGIGIGGVVTHSPPSRPGEFRPEPLTEPDVNLSIHPARATPKRLPPCGKTMSSSGYPLTQSHRG